MPKGAYRRVLLVGRFAWKFPRLRNFREGMRCNRWEREMWRIWRPTFGWESLCPVVFADPLGLLVVMPRVDQPVSQEDVEIGRGDPYPAPTGEWKPDDHGRLDGKVVVVDYGIWAQDDVERERAYYARLAKARAGD